LFPIQHGYSDLLQVSDKLYHIMLYTSPWPWFELTTSVVIRTDCICSCKSNHHTITATMDGFKYDSYLNAISSNHHWCCQFESRWGRCVQHYVIKFVRDLQKVGGFFQVLRELCCGVCIKWWLIRSSHN
jgi:hypothetical protein